MNKRKFLFGIVLLVAGQFLTAQELQLITLSADGEEAVYALTNVQKIVFDNNTMTVNMKAGADVTNIKRISFNQNFSEDYSGLKLNEVSGVGNDADKFYELINIGTEAVSLEGCKIYYNANSSVNGVFPPNGNQGLTWTGCANQVIGAGELLCIIGRNNPCSFTTGLTAERMLIITLEDPNGNILDRCARAGDIGVYAISNKSFSRIPDGTGNFYFTLPTPDVQNGYDATDLLLVPETKDWVGIKTNEATSIFVFPNPVKNTLTVTGVGKAAKINLVDLNGALLQSIYAQDKTTNIDVSSLQQGTYLLQIGEMIVKFIKQ